jgi:hypothetical protein
MHHASLVPIASYATPFEAEFVHGLLRDAGFVAAVDSGHIHTALSAFGGVPLLVRLIKPSPRKRIFAITAILSCSPNTRFGTADNARRRLNRILRSAGIAWAHERMSKGPFLRPLPLPGSNLIPITTRGTHFRGPLRTILMRRPASAPFRNRGCRPTKCNWKTGCSVPIERP